MSVSSADGRPASTSCSKVPQHLREEHPKLFKVFNQLDVGAWLSTLARRGICRHQSTHFLPSSCGRGSAPCPPLSLQK